jgi:hypothetical protein
VQREDMSTMIDGKFQNEEHLTEVIFKIIRELQPITTTDIWFEVGEDYRHRISKEEITEILSHLEKKMRISMEDEKWKLRGKYSSPMELSFS